MDFLFGILLRSIGWRGLFILARIMRFCPMWRTRLAYIVFGGISAPTAPKSSSRALCRGGWSLAAHPRVPAAIAPPSPTYFCTSAPMWGGFTSTPFLDKAHVAFGEFYIYNSPGGLLSCKCNLDLDKTPIIR